MSKFKVETLEEFLVRGGSITKVPYKEPEETVKVLPVSVSNDPHAMDLSSGSLYYSEAASKTKTPKKGYKNTSVIVDTSKLPPGLLESLKIKAK